MHKDKLLVLLAGKAFVLAQQRVILKKLILHLMIPTLGPQT